jgi:hypothetical protein
MELCEYFESSGLWLFDRQADFHAFTSITTTKIIASCRACVPERCSNQLKLTNC